MAAEEDEEDDGLGPDGGQTYGEMSPGRFAFGSQTALDRLWTALGAEDRSSYDLGRQQDEADEKAAKKRQRGDGRHDEDENDKKSRRITWPSLGGRYEGEGGEDASSVDAWLEQE